MGSTGRFVLLSCFLAVSLAEFDDFHHGFQNGADYNYKYFVSLVNIEKYNQKLNFVNYTADFTLKVFDKEGFLKIKNVAITNGEKQVELAADKNVFTEYYTRFNIDGKISAVKTDKREPDWVFNFKRGLLSLFHIETNEKNKTTGIHGTCETIFEKTSDTGFSKSTNIGECNEEDYAYDRFYLFIMSFYVKFTQPRGDQICNYTMAENVMQTISCNESLRLSAFTNMVHQKTLQNVTLQSVTPHALTLQSYLDSISFEPGKEYANLKYEAVNTEPINLEAMFNQARETFALTCSSDFNNHSIQKRDPFVILLSLFKHFDERRLNALYKFSGKCENSRNMFIDLLAMVQTSSSLNFMISLIKDDDVDQYTQEEWLTVLSYSKRLENTSITKAEKLLMAKPKVLNVILTVGSIVGSYCKEHENCSLIVGPLKTAYEIYIDSLYLNKAVDDSEELLLVYMKGLFNMGLKMTDMKCTFKKILSDKSLSASTRKQAIELLMDQTENYTYLEDVFEDPKEDIEVRSYIYLQLNALEYNHFLPFVYKVLKNENGQVAHFIWSSFHEEEYDRYSDYTTEKPKPDALDVSDKIFLRSRMTGIKAEVSKTRYNVLLEAIKSCSDLTKPDAKDETKFSYHLKYEKPYSNYYNYSVIFTPKSFVPSNLNFNIGDKMNKKRFEFNLDVSIEDIEEYVLAFFELEGKSLSQKLKQAEVENISKRIARSIRKELENPRVAFSFKALNKYLKQFNFNGHQPLKQLLSEYNYINYLNRTLAGSGRTFKRSGALYGLESHGVTGAGFPVFHNFIVDFFFDLNVHGNFQADNFDKTRLLDFEGSITPFLSAGIYMDTYVDTYHTKPSIKFSAGASITVPIKTKVHVQGWNNIDIELYLPKEFVLELKLDRYTDKELNLTIPPLEILHCEDFDRTSSSYEYCSTFDRFSKALEVFKQKQSVYVPVVIKLKDNVDLRYWKGTWTKVEESKYKITVGSNVRNNSTAEEVFVEINKDKILSVKLTNGESSLHIQGEYDNKSEFKYIKIDVYDDGRKVKFSRNLGFFLELYTFNYIFTLPSLFVVYV